MEDLLPGVAQVDVKAQDGSWSGRGIVDRMVPWSPHSDEGGRLVGAW